MKTRIFFIAMMIATLVLCGCDTGSSNTKDPDVSAAVVPSYDDGSIKITGTDDKINFVVLPSGWVDSLISAYDSRGVFSFEVVDTLTGAGNGKSLAVTAAKRAAGEQLSLAVDAAGLGSGFSDGSERMSARLVIQVTSSADSQVKSEYFPLYASYSIRLHTTTLATSQL